MAENEHKSVNVMISGRSYPVRISDVEEAYIRDVEHEINEQIRTFQLKYTSKDKQDCLAMALLTYAVRLKQTKDKLNDQSLLEHLDQIDAILSETLA